MEKFHYVEELTKQYLNGNLVRLRIDYEDDVEMNVEISYEDADEFHLYYDLLVNQDKQSIQFVKHFCNYGRDFINLRRNRPFEEAMKAYFFPSKNDSN